MLHIFLIYQRQLATLARYHRSGVRGRDGEGLRKSQPELKDLHGVHIIAEFMTADKEDRKRILTQGPA